MRQLVQESVSLQTPRARLLIFLGLSLAIFFSHYHWLDHLSLWDNVGLHWVPSIGLTRAYWLLLHGSPTAAWHRNPLIYLILAIGLPLLACDLLRIINRHPEIPQNLL